MIEELKTAPKDHIGAVVYFIQAGPRGPIKVGYCSTPAQVPGRLLTLQCANAERLVLRRVVCGSRRLETDLHNEFAQWRLAGEWFMPAAPVVAASCGLQAKIGTELSTARIAVDRAYEIGRRVGRFEGKQEAFSEVRYRLEESVLPGVIDDAEEAQAQLIDEKAQAVREHPALAPGRIGSKDGSISE